MKQPTDPTSLGSPTPHSASADAMSDTQLSDLQWLAFCYLANEMSSTEAAAFEDRLEWDVLAQSALIEMSALSQTIIRIPEIQVDGIRTDSANALSPVATAPRSVQSRSVQSRGVQSRSWRTVFGGWALVGSFMLALLLASMWWNNSSPVPEQELASPDLAELWASQFQVPRSGEEATGLEMFVMEVEDSGFEDRSLSNELVDCTYDEDDWLTSAVMALGDMDDLDAEGL